MFCEWGCSQLVTRIIELGSPRDLSSTPGRGRLNPTDSRPHEFGSTSGPWTGIDGLVPPSPGPRPAHHLAGAVSLCSGCEADLPAPERKHAMKCRQSIPFDTCSVGDLDNRRQDDVVWADPSGGALRVRGPGVRAVCVGLNDVLSNVEPLKPRASKVSGIVTCK